VLRHLASDRADLPAIAAALGADVPSQLDPRFTLVAGAGERVEGLPDPGEFAAVLVPDDEGLETAAVYAEADRIGVLREPAELAEMESRLREAAGSGATPLDYAELLVNDLERAALSLRPQLAEALDALSEVGAAVALVTGSGPTAVGLFRDLAVADRAAASLPPRYAGAIVSAPQRYL
jgi:4-diphosphocytidyl-2-C-methyl-D-erythritol kinase